MKGKLRELAEMVREAYRAGFIAACKWPEPVSQDVDSPAYNKEFNDWSFSVREKHAAILDAEGDGGAVDWIDGAPNKIYASEWFIAQTTNRERVVLTALPEEYTYDFKTADDTYIMRSNIKRWMQFPDSQFIPYTETHPARSGVVSDKDVEAAREAYFNAANVSDGVFTDSVAMRAALENFAKGETK